MKTTKRILSIFLALVLGLMLIVPAAADSPCDLPEGITVKMVRKPYIIGPQYIGGIREGSFVIMRDGEVVYESHARGHGMDVPQSMWSVTKSIVSALTGIAIREGFIESVDQKVIDFYPEAKIDKGQESKRDMTIEHLLTMTSGLPGALDRGEMNCLMADDAGLAAFESKQAAAPGERFSYSSGAGPQALVGLLQRVIGRNLDDFAQEHLFGPLGMDSVTWSTAKDGSPTGGMGISMSPRDMLRFGQFYLQNGVWKGQQILPEGWVEQSKPFLKTRLSDYGYLLWGGDHGELGRFIGARGLGGQIISAYPETGLVVVRTGNPSLLMRTVGLLRRILPIF